MGSEELHRWVTIKQAAEYYQVNPKTIRRLIADGKLTARRIGPRSIRINREALRQLGGVDYWGT